MKLKSVILFVFIYFWKPDVLFAQVTQVEMAYKKKSKQALKIFLDDWSKAIRPVTVEDLSKLNNSIQQAYSVFETFYNPHDLASRGGSQFGNDSYLPYNYFLIRPQLKIFVAEKVYFTEDETRVYTISEINKRVKSDSLKKEFINRYDTGQNEQLIEYWGPYGLVYPDTLEKLVESLTDFRPRITQTSAIPLYLTDNYNKVLNDFLGNTNIPFGQEGFVQTAKATGESKNRMTFLENFIKIYYGHWGGSWDLLTPPIVYKMVFDKDFKYVKVDFKMVYEGGTAFLRFEKGRWIMISAKRTWKE